MRILPDWKIFRKKQPVQEVSPWSFPQGPELEKLIRREENPVGMDKWRPVVAPITHDELMSRQPNRCPDGDMWIRLASYLEIDQIFMNDGSMYAAADRMCGGAVGNQPFTITVTGKTEQRAYTLEAERIKAACEPVPFLLDPTRFKEDAIDLGAYGNLPFGLAFKGRELVDIKTFPPHGFRIHLDSRMRFDKNQKICYTQYDINSWEVVDTFDWHQIVWSKYGGSSFRAYGISPISRVRQDVMNASAGMVSMRQARDNLSPFVAYLLGQGQPLDDVRLGFFKRALPFFKRLAGINVQKGEPNILNGASDAKVMAPPTDYFNQLNDVVMAQQRASMAYKVARALSSSPEDCNARVFELLIEMMYGDQATYARVLTDRILIPIFHRICDKNGLDYRMVNFKITWGQSQTPSRMLQMCLQARTAWLDGIITDEAYQLINCMYLGLDAESEIAHLKEIGAWPLKKPDGLDMVPAEHPNNNNNATGNVLNEKPQLQVVHGDNTWNGRRKAANMGGT